MSSRRKFKKEINDVLSEVIDDCYAVQLEVDDKVSKKVEKLIDEAIDTFDELIAQLHLKDVSDTKAHYRKIKSTLTEKSAALSEKLAKLNS